VIDILNFFIFMENKIFLKGLLFGVALFVYGIALRLLLASEITAKAPEQVWLVFGMLSLCVVLALTWFTAYAVCTKKSPLVAAITFVIMALSYVFMRCLGTRWLLGVDLMPVQHPLEILPLAALGAMIIGGTIALFYRLYLVTRGQDEPAVASASDAQTVSDKMSRITTISWIAFGFYLAFCCWILCRVSI
jgi:hypothetical protein